MSNTRIWNQLPFDKKEKHLEKILNCWKENPDMTLVALGKRFKYPGQESMKKHLVNNGVYPRKRESDWQAINNMSGVLGCDFNPRFKRNFS